MDHLTKISLKLEAAGGPFEDPALLVTPTNANESVLLDCGTLHSLKTRNLLKVKWLFLTHLHIDHLIGFDHLLRLRLFSDLPLIVFGPPGTVETIGHRLQGYSWNLTSGSPFQVQVIDLPSSPQAFANSQVFRCHNSFVAEKSQLELNWLGSQCLAIDHELRVHWYPVEHGVPCFCYRLERTIPPKFSLQKCLRLGLKPGPWVSSLMAGEALTQEVNGVERDQHWLAQRLLETRAAQSIGYLSDTRLEQKLLEELSDFFREVDVLVSETAYLESESKQAWQNLHMTTKQVANLALRSRAQLLLIFHFSRRHLDNGTEPHLREVRAVFPNSNLLEAANQPFSF